MLQKKMAFSLLTGAAMVAALAAMPSAAFAKGGPPTTELTNNLSVPAIMVPGPGTFTVSCPADVPGPLVAPTGEPSTGYTVPGYYYVQGVNAWQAQCYTAAAGTTTAMGDFGDNLTSGALKAGTPIRVEVGLIENSGSGITLDGYKVIKLQTSLSDNQSAYGTEATGTEGSWSATAQTFPYVSTDGETGAPVTVGVRVFDQRATFELYNETTQAYVVPQDTPMGAEINATGAVVYGYNWGVGGHGVKNLPQAGTYTLTFTAPDVTLNGVSASGGGSTTALVDEHSVSITFAVVGSTNGGGGHRG